MRRQWSLAAVVAVGTATALSVSGPAAAAPHVAAGASFVTGQPQASTVGGSGCGTNTAGEPSIHVSKANLVGLGSENGVGGGSAYWRKTQLGGQGASACALTYSGQPNAVSGIGASGGDIDTAFAPVKDPTTGNYRIYVASLNLGSINVATSTDNGATFSQVPVQAGVPVDDREWIAAYGATTSLLTYHDIVTNNIDVLRSDTGGGPYTQISQAIPATDYKAINNELGNIVIDHNNGSPVPGGFYAYQSFVAPSEDPGPGAAVTGAPYDEAFMAVSDDGGHTFTDRAIPCSTKSGGTLNHQFPNVSVAPNGTLVDTWSNDKNVYGAFSRDHGTTWTCTGAISTNTRQAIEPWVVAGASGVDLVYYATTDAPGPNQTWSVYFTQLGSAGATTPKAIVTVHKGEVCESGAGCTGGRQLLDDFGIDTDQGGYAHIAYTHDAPALGGTGSYTGYAVQTAGPTIGAPN